MFNSVDRCLMTLSFTTPASMLRDRSIWLTRGETRGAACAATWAAGSATWAAVGSPADGWGSTEPPFAADAAPAAPALEPLFPPFVLFLGVEKTSRVLLSLEFGLCASWSLLALPS